MRVDVRERQADLPIDVLEPQTAATLGIVEKIGTEPAIGMAVSDEAARALGDANTSIYHFASHMDGEAAVRLLTRNGFDGLDLALVGATPCWDRHRLGFHWNDSWIKSRYRHRTIPDRVTRVLFAPAIFFMRGVDIFVFLARLASEHSGICKVMGSRAADLETPRTRNGVLRKRTFNHDAARRTDPHDLVMHGSSIDASRAHRVLVDHTNDVIEGCLKFRQ
jgi:hypothetical protein